MMKFAWLPALILLGAAGCHSDAYYQEQAVESAREFIFKHARELTPEQYSVVKFNPPVILSGSVFEPAGTTKAEDAVMGEEKRQFCITWRIPGADNDYLVYGVSEPRMAYWKPLKLIRRRISPAPAGPAAALNNARQYAVTALDGQLTFADLNTVRFTHPALLLTAFPLQGMRDENDAAEETAAAPSGVRKTSPRDGFISGGIPPVKSPVEVAPQVQPQKEEVKHPFPRPWQRITVPREGKDGLVQLSLVWKISGDRRVVFCGVGREDLAPWIICQVGVLEKNELDDNTLRELKTPENFLFKVQKDDEDEDPEKTVNTVQPRSESPDSERKEGDGGPGAAETKTAPAGKKLEQLLQGNGAGEQNGKSRESGSEPGKGI